MVEITPITQNLLSYLQIELRNEGLERVEILCSYIKATGVILLRDSLLLLAANKVPVHLIATRQHDITECRGVQILSEYPNIRIKMFVSEECSLHAKTWLFYNRSGVRTVIVGSSNISRPALLDAIEWSVQLRFDKSEYSNNSFRIFQETFKSYWDQQDPRFQDPRLQDPSLQTPPLQEPRLRPFIFTDWNMYKCFSNSHTCDDESCHICQAAKQTAAQARKYHGRKRSGKTAFSRQPPARRGNFSFSDNHLATFAFSNSARARELLHLAIDQGDKLGVRQAIGTMKEVGINVLDEPRDPEISRADEDIWMELNPSPRQKLWDLRPSSPPLFSAVAYGDLEIMEILLTEGADPNARLLDEPLLAWVVDRVEGTIDGCVEYNMEENIEEYKSFYQGALALLQKWNANLNVLTKDLKTPLHLAAELDGFKYGSFWYDTLVSMGADENMPSGTHSETPKEILASYRSAAPMLQPRKAV